MIRLNSYTQRDSTLEWLPSPLRPRYCLVFTSTIFCHSSYGQADGWRPSTSSPEGVSMVPCPHPGANSRGNHMWRMVQMVSLDSWRSPKRGVVVTYSASSSAIALSDQPCAANSPIFTSAGKLTGSRRTGIRGGFHVDGAPSGALGYSGGK